MLRGLTTFFRKRQVLVQFFSWPHPGVDDWDIDFRTKPAHADHFPSEIVNPNPFAHFEHEDVRSLRKARRLDDEPSRLGSVHEVTRHIRMSDRNRPTEVDLPGECWDDATTTT